MIFPEPAIPDECGQRPDESMHAYILRCTRPSYARVRHLINAWFREISDSKETLHKRLSNPKNDREFKAAFTELLTFVYFKRLGCKVEYSPDIGTPEGSNRTPDLLVSPKNGPEFLVEVTTVDDKSKPSIEEHNRINDVEQAVENVNTFQYYFDVVISGIPKSTPSQKKITKAIESWIGEMSYHEVLAHRNQKMYSKKFQIDESCSLKLWLRPILPENFGITDSRIGYIMFEPEKGELEKVILTEPIRKAIKKKLNRYQGLDMPIVVAVNVLSGVQIDSFVFKALIGDIEYKTGSPEPFWNVKSDAVWHKNAKQKGWINHGKLGSQYRKNFALLIFEKILPDRIGGSIELKHYAVFNPFSENHLETVFQDTPKIQINHQDFQFSFQDIPGRPLCDILGIQVPNTD